MNANNPFHAHFHLNGFQNTKMYVLFGSMVTHRCYFIDKLAVALANVIQMVDHEFTEKSDLSSLTFSECGFVAVQRDSSIELLEDMLIAYLYKQKLLQHIAGPLVLSDAAILSHKGQSVVLTSRHQILQYLKDALTEYQTNYTSTIGQKLIEESQKDVAKLPSLRLNSDLGMIFRNLSVPINKLGNFSTFVEDLEDLVTVQNYLIEKASQAQETNTSGQKKMAYKSYPFNAMLFSAWTSGLRYRQFMSKALQKASKDLDSAEGLEALKTAYNSARTNLIALVSNTQLSKVINFDKSEYGIDTVEMNEHFVIDIPPTQLHPLPLPAVRQLVFTQNSSYEFFNLMFKPQL